jgi:DNA-binding transcriptional LysR family regulator
MRYFTAALHRGSFTGAAEHLNVAASAVAAAIDQIEAHFQLTLITRHRARGIEPTAEGRNMARRFARLLEEYDAVLEEGRGLQQGLSGDFRLGYYAPVAPAFLPQILAPLMPPHSGLRPILSDCSNDAAQAGLAEGRFDAILFVPDGTHPQLDYDPLLEAPAYALLPAKHPLARRKNLSLTDLAREPLITLNRPMVTSYLHRMFQRLGRVPDTIAETDTTEMVRAMVGTGLGCAVLNMRPATDVTYAGTGLAARPLTDAGPPLTLALGYNKKNPRRATREFAARCRAWAASPEAGAFTVT